MRNKTRIVLGVTLTLSLLIGDENRLNSLINQQSGGYGQYNPVLSQQIQTEARQIQIDRNWQSPSLVPSNPFNSSPQMGQVQSRYRSNF
jgi:hypothetical protein